MKMTDPLLKQKQLILQCVEQSTSRSMRLSPIVVENAIYNMVTMIIKPPRALFDGVAAPPNLTERMPFGSKARHSTTKQTSVRSNTTHATAHLKRRMNKLTKSKEGYTILSPREIQSSISTDSTGTRMHPHKCSTNAQQTRILRHFAATFDWRDGDRHSTRGMLGCKLSAHYCDSAGIGTGL
jgi:hypothetical protein